MSSASNARRHARRLSAWLGRRVLSSRGDALRWLTNSSLPRFQAHASVGVNAHRHRWNAPALAHTLLTRAHDPLVAGWSPPKIAEHLGRHPHTVRAALKGFAARGAEALYPGAPGPDPDHDRRAAVTGTLSELLGQERTWTAGNWPTPSVPASASGVARPAGIRPSRRPATGAPPRPSATSRTPARSSGRGAPSTRWEKVEAGRVRLFDLDESGFTPSLPTGYSWCLPKQRKRVKYEYPQGRRVNALATYEPLARRPGFMPNRSSGR